MNLHKYPGMNEFQKNFALLIPFPMNFLKLLYVFRHTGRIKNHLISFLRSLELLMAISFYFKKMEVTMKINPLCQTDMTTLKSELSVCEDSKYSSPFFDDGCGRASLVMLLLLNDLPCVNIQPVVHNNRTCHCGMIQCTLKSHSNPLLHKSSPFISGTNPRESCLFLF